MAALQPDSREFMGVPITVNGDPAGNYPTEIAFWPYGTPFDADTATWYPAVQIDAGHVGILVGPGGTATPAPGKYTVYARVTAPPELPILKSGTLTIN